jgi:hypothetical protein
VLLARGCDGSTLLDGYGGRPPGLEWYTAASVLARIALPAVTRVRPALLGRLPDLLDAAGAMLA